MGGAYSQTKIRNFTTYGDEPTSIMGTDRSPNAVEAVLAALGSCLVVCIVYGSVRRGIRIHSLEMEMVGNLDLQGFFGIRENVRPGYQDIQVNYHIRSDASREEMEEIIRHAERTSPVADIIRNPVALTTNLVDYTQSSETAAAPGRSGEAGVSR